MAHFAYKARNSSGELVRGVLESADSGAAATQLFNLGITPVEITPTRAPRAPGTGIFAGLLKEKITPLDLMFFSRLLHTLLKAGVPILQALNGLQASASKAFAAVIKDIRESLDAGRELSTSLARQPAVFSQFYISMVRVGEMTGKLDEIFLRMYEHLEFEKFMREQVKTATRYPTFVIATMALAIVVINLFVIPAFARVYKSANAKLPWVTQLLIDFSNFMVASWPLLLVATVGGFFGFRAWTRTRAGKYAWDRFKLRIPIAGKIILKATLSRFARSFALASRAGVPLVQVLSTVAQTVDNDFLIAKIHQMREGVERGESILRTATATEVFTPVVLQMIAVGEESGSLDELMEEIADVYRRDVEYDLKTLSAQIEPILIIFLGALVLVLALGVFLPIWDLGKTLR